jgi:hypothetical protein
MSKIMQIIEKSVRERYASLPTTIFHVGSIWLIIGFVVVTKSPASILSTEMTELGAVFVFLGGSEKIFADSPFRWLSRVVFVFLFVLMSYHIFASLIRI